MSGRPQPPDDAEARIALAERLLGVTFTDHELLRRALTHPSYTFEQGAREPYERLEFLGDSVLGFIMTDHIYRTFPDFPEGEMAKLRATLVSGRMLAEIAGGLGLGDAILMGHGAEATGARQLASVLADAFEAIVGAMYLDRGVDVTRTFVLAHLGPRAVPGGLPAGWQDFKSELQERTMAAFGETPTYRIVAVEGLPHERSFTAEVLLAGRLIGQGSGPSKKDAEKAAAEQALHAFDQAAERHRPGR